MVQLFNNKGEELRRVFIPEADPCHSRIPYNELVVYNRSKQVWQLQFETQHLPVRRDENTVVVCIDGACRGNGTTQARASYGMCFGPGSQYNTSGLLPPSLSQTSTRAELEALVVAVDIVKDICSKDIGLFKIKIVTDSAYLVVAMSDWINEWKDTGAYGSNGREVAHWEVWEELVDKVDEMEYGDDGGIEIQMWKVDRERNTQGDRLANNALDVYFAPRTPYPVSTSASD